MLRKILKFSGIIFLILGLLVALSTYKLQKYLESNETKILENLTFLQGGKITFESTSISLFKNFPSASLVVKNVRVQDSLFESAYQPFLQIGELQALLSVKDIIAQKIEVNSLKLADGKINYWRLENGYHSLKNILNPSIYPSKDNKDRPFWKNIQLKSKQLEIVLINMGVLIKDKLKTSKIEGKIKHLKTILDFSKENFSTQIALKMRLKKLIFNKKNGSFLEDSKIDGIFNFSLSDSTLQIQPFDLAINEETFRTSASINLRSDEPSLLVFENKASKLDNIRPLLSERLQTVLKPYSISKPFYSKTSIQTNFQRGYNPIVTVDFTLKKQPIFVHNIPFIKTNLKGRFINRIFEDERKFEEGRYRYRLILEDVSALYKGFHIQTSHLLVSAKEKFKPQLQVKANISGKPKSISNWIGNNQFFFENGRFNLSTAIAGPLTNLNQLIKETDAKLDLYNFSVIYQPANVTFPFKQLNLYKEADLASFSLINNSSIKGHELSLNGKIQNFPTLLIEAIEPSVKSEAHIITKKLSWTNFIDFFEAQGLFKNKTKKSSRQKKQSMKKTLKGIYANFFPELSIQIDTLAYLNLLQIDKFKSSLHFENEHTLILEQTSFEFEGGTVDFSGKLDISHVDKTPFEFNLKTNQLNLQKALPPLNYFNIRMLKNLERLPDHLNLTITHKGVLDDENGLIPNSSTGEVMFEINSGKDLKGKISYQPIEATLKDDLSIKTFGKTQIELEGNPKVFNDFFKTEQFFFKDGQFKVAFEYEGNPGSIAELLTNGNATFSLNDSEVFYKPVGVTFPLTEIDLKLEDDTAIFDFNLDAEVLGEKIHLIGNLINISELLIGNTGKQILTEVEINSRKIDWTSLFTMLSSEKNGDSNAKSESAKASVRGILNTFHPHFHVNVDSFIYSDKLSFRHLIGGLYLKDSTTVILERTEFDFNDGRVLVDGEFNIGQHLITPFSSNIQTHNLGIYALLKNLNYLALPSLKSIDKLGGNVSMNFDLAGTIDDNANSLIPEATKGKLAFDLRDIVLIGLKPLDVIANRMRMKKRFEELRFAPIAGVIHINGQEIEFPQLEIQSNAMHLFMEGTLSYGDLTNIWVSVPLNNIRRTNRWIIPEKTGYAAAKRKIHIEVTSDEAGNNKFKLRLSKRKFYKKRGILDQFRKDKKRERAIRKSLRKGETVSLY